MFEKDESHRYNGQTDREFSESSKEIESVICRLHQLADRVARVRLYCEEFKGKTIESKMELPVTRAPSVNCSSCGHALDPCDAVVVKNSDGKARAHYHIACFRTLLSTTLSRK